MSDIRILDAEGKPIKYSSDVSLLDADGSRLVLEADLMAVKKGSEKQIADIQEAAKTSISDLKVKADTNYQDMLRERASREELEGKATGLNTKVEELTNKLKDAGESSELVKKLQTDLLGLKRTRLTELYPNVFKPEELEGKTIQEIDTLGEALKLVKAKAGGGFDSAGGGGGTPLSGKEALRASIDAAKAR